MNQELQYCVGLNLGPQEEHSSMAVMERRLDAETESGYTFTVVGLERCPQGTPYWGVVEWVKVLLADYPLEQIAALTVGGTVVDQTVVDLLEQAGFGDKLEVVVITD